VVSWITYHLQVSNAKTQALLAYSDDGKLIIKLLAIGSHENFYRDLKR
jgi:hypothetical protein